MAASPRSHLLSDLAAGLELMEHLADVRDDGGQLVDDNAPDNVEFDAEVVVRSTSRVRIISRQGNSGHLSRSVTETDLAASPRTVSSRTVADWRILAASNSSRDEPANSAADCAASSMCRSRMWSDVGSVDSQRDCV